ncbi:MAG: acyl transferase [Bacteroidia bacterium]
MFRKIPLSQINKDNFKEYALDVFRFQAEENPIYKTYLKQLNINFKTISELEKIPFLPIEFFKTHEIISEKKISETVFTSSATTGTIPSKHYVAELSLYRESFTKAFQLFYGKITDYCVLALLPSYLEREGSSLILMVEELIQKSQNKNSGFYLHNQQELAEKIIFLEQKKQKIILIGVTYALLELAETQVFSVKNTIVMETGGMKGKRKEMLREELHLFLCERFGVKKIHSEYGMTELLSQAYSKGDGVFECPPWMRVLVRDVNDPFSIVAHEKSGGINVIDLANIYSCAFIATQDLGKLHSENNFEVLGRFDNSDIRGCNLMMQ